MCFLAFSFEKGIENFPISYFILSVICSADNSVTKLGLWHKELLNFHNALPLDMSIFLDIEKNMGN